MKSTMSELTGVITLKSIWGKDRKLVVEPVKDARTNWYLGVARLSDDDKRKLKVWVDPTVKYTIRNGTAFNLNNETDKLNWEWIQHCSEIAGSFEEAQHSPNALFYVSNEDREAKKTQDADELILKAMNLVRDDSPDNLPMRSRLLGFNMDGETTTAIRNFLMKMAKSIESAPKVINVYESNQMSLQLLYLRAMDKKVIKLVNGAYMYGQTVLGITEEAVFTWMKDPLNHQAVLEMDKEVNPERNSKLD